MDLQAVLIGGRWSGMDLKTCSVRKKPKSVSSPAITSSLTAVYETSTMTAPMKKTRSSTLLALCVLNFSEWGILAFSPLQTARPKTPAVGRLYSSTTAYDSSYSSQFGGDDPAGAPLAMPGQYSELKTTGGRVGSQQAHDMWEAITPLVIQGGSLRTWSFPTPALERVQLLLETEGMPLMANIKLVQGPDNTPQNMDITMEKGMLRPFRCVMETPGGKSSVFIRNTGPLEYPLNAYVAPELEGSSASSEGLDAMPSDLYTMTTTRVLQGGSVYTSEFDPSVQMVKVVLKTDGRPLNARIELLQGPNSIKETIQLYTEDGLDRPLFSLIETPGMGNTIRVVNTGPIAFPIVACVEPFEMDTTTGAGALGP